MSSEPTVGGYDPSAIARQAPAGRVSQFGLLRTRRLLPLFITQFLGAFNDNLYKFALTLILVYGGLISEDATDLLVNVAAGLLILPFFLFSATAGTLADRYEKSRLIRYVKLGEIAVAICAALALYLQDVTALLAVVFLLGVQSTFFGPLKFAILPQHLHNTELVGGNAMVEMGTLVAILLGTIAGGIIGGATAGDNTGNVSLVLSVMVVLVAVTGYLSSLGIPRAPSALRGSVSWNPVTETWGLIRLAAEKKAVFQSVLGVSWFWLIGSVYLAQIANMTRLHLAGDSGVVTLILAFFTISIAVGSLLCEKLSGRRVEIGLVPLGAAGISLFGIDSFFAMGQIEAEGLRTAGEFLAGEGTPRLLADLGLMGMFAGMFVVPLQANIQARTPDDRRARIIAANNVLNALFLVAGSGLAIFWLVYLDFSIPTLFLFVAIANAAVAGYIFQQVPEFTMRFLVWLLSHSMYRVRHEGLESIPERGGAVIVCNHVSYVDALLLAGAIRRPIRFVMARSIYDLPVLNFVFRTSRTIPITSKRADPDTYEAAFAQIREALESRHVVCIFPGRPPDPRRRDRRLPPGNRADRRRDARTGGADGPARPVGQLLQPPGQGGVSPAVVARLEPGGHRRGRPDFAGERQRRRLARTGDGVARGVAVKVRAFRDSAWQLIGGRIGRARHDMLKVSSDACQPFVHAEHLPGKGRQERRGSPAAGRGRVFHCSCRTHETLRGRSACCRIVSATQQVSFCAVGMWRNSFGPWAFDSGPSTPVTRNWAAGNSAPSIAMNGIVPPSPMYMAGLPK